MIKMRCLILVAKNVDVESVLEQYFEQNSKFFADGDQNGKRAFFALGMYYHRVMESLEKQIAEAGAETPEQTKFVKRINREISLNMSYRSFTTISKLLDNMARTVNSKLFISCGGICKQYIINSEVRIDKKKLPASDANMAFSLGAVQH
jgi:hypothetical protein